MISKYFSNEHHHVEDRELDDLYQLVRKHDKNYVLEEINVKTKSFLGGWFDKNRRRVRTYTLYHYNGADYIAVENNVDKYTITYFFKGILHSHR